MRPSGEKATEGLPRPAEASGRPTRRQPSVAQRSALPSTWPPASRLPSGEKATERTCRRSAAWRPARRCGRRESRRRRDRFVPERAPNGIASCEPSGLKASPRTEGGRCSGGRQLAPVEVPDPHRAPHVRRGEQTARGRRRAPGRCRGCSAPGPRGARRSGPTRFPDPASQSPTPPPRSGHRQPTPVGRVLDRERRPVGERLEAAVLRSVSASISSTRPSSLATARVRPSGLSANAAGIVAGSRCARRCGTAARAGGRRPRPR